jgi:hypothetical protein
MFESEFTKNKKKNCKKPIKVARQPADEAALLVMLGVKLRLNRWGIGILAVSVIVLAGLVMLWASPLEVGALIAAITKG